MNTLQTKIKMAKGEIKPDIVFKNVKLIDVFSNKIIEGNLAVHKGQILGIGDYRSDKEIDLEGKYICPGLIDAHVHIESSMSTAFEFSKILFKNGVTTIIADPHEIANVMGIEGIEYIIDSSKDLDLDVKIMLPSCVPATDKETSGAKLEAKDLEKFIEEESVYGLGEMMNYVGLLSAEGNVLVKLELFKDKIIDGHAPGLAGKDLNAYILTGIKTDHESSTIQEMNERIQKGMYVLIRQGTAAKNSQVLTKGITKDNLSRCLFCSDDKHPEDLVNKGSINQNIKIAIENGLDPIDAIKIATINPAICYGLKNKGALAPGYEASFIVLDNLEEFKIDKVFVKTRLVADKNKVYVEDKSKKVKSLGKINIYDFKPEDFQIRMKSDVANVIGIIENELVTEKLQERVKVEDGIFIADETYSKLLVIDRHRASKNIGKAIIKGFSIKNGAIAQTIAHDSHNIIIVGDNDLDMYLAMKEIQKNKGGIAVVQNSKVLKSLPLEIAGLMSNKSIEEIHSILKEILYAIENKLGVGKKKLDPILTLGFMALPVIPKVKLTDKGLFDVEKFEFIDLSM